MGNFEKLSVLVIVVIIVMILVVALYTWTGDPDDSTTAEADKGRTTALTAKNGEGEPKPPAGKSVKETNWGEIFKNIEGDKPIPPVQPDKVEPKVETKLELPVVDTKSTEANWEYTVQSGDMISVISERELGTIRRQGEILALNPTVDPRGLKPGQALVMPPRNAPGGPAASGGATPGPATAATGSAKPGEWYVIQRGDRLSTLSKRIYKTTERWPDIWASNLAVINNPDEPPTGARIFLPR